MDGVTIEFSQDLAECWHMADETVYLIETSRANEEPSTMYAFVRVEPETLKSANRICSNCRLPIYAETEEDYIRLVESCKEDDRQQQSW